MRPRQPSLQRPREDAGSSMWTIGFGLLLPVYLCPVERFALSAHPLASSLIIAIVPYVCFRLDFVIALLWLLHDLTGLLPVTV